MPEGDTVYRTAFHLNEVLTGRTITDWSLRVPQHATSDLRGCTVDEVVSRGKHILHRIGDMTLHTHLKMEGDWHIYPHGARWKKPGWKARAVVGTETHTTVGFELGVVDLIRRADEDSVVGHLGPDLLGADWSAERAIANVESDPSRPISVALLDQRTLAGLGNEYVAELCFLRGIRPDTPVGDTDAAAIVQLAHRLITANRDRVVRTTTGDTRHGRQSWVHARSGKPCLRCGTIIEEGSLGRAPTQERVTFWCPRCQR